MYCSIRALHTAPFTRELDAILDGKPRTIYSLVSLQRQQMEIESEYKTKTTPRCSLIHINLFAGAKPLE